jgi:hypothetical protein
MSIRSKPVSKRLHSSEKPATNNDASFARQTAGATARSQSSDGGPRAGGAYHLLWHLVNETRREIRLARLEYPLDQLRIDRLMETLAWLLVVLLPYERPKLKPVAAPSQPHLAPEEMVEKLAELSAEELELLDKVALKIHGAPEGSE